MFKITKTQTRTDANILFGIEAFPMPPDILDYVKSSYIQNNRLLKSTTHMSEDKLKLTTVTEWASRDDFRAYCMDANTYEVSIVRRNHDVDNDIKNSYIIEGD
jgi:hypothetical protein